MPFWPRSTQSISEKSTCLLELQTRAPCRGRFEKRSDPARVEPGLFNCGNHRLLIVENALGSGRDAALDLCGGQAPAAIHASGRAFHQGARNVVAIAAVAFHRVARRQARTALVEEFANERT